MATIRDVAKECGLSVATVSYVLNEGPRPVAPETRQRVLAAIERLRYHPSSAARALNRKERHCFGVLFPSPDPHVSANPFFASLVAGMMEEAARRGQDLMLLTGMTRTEGELNVSELRAKGIDGVILVVPRLSQRVDEELREAGLTFVVLGESHASAPFVVADEEAAWQDLAQHLSDMGHREIVWVPGDPEAPSTPRRRAYLSEAVQRFGLVFNPMLEGVSREYYPRHRFDPNPELQWGRLAASLVDAPGAVAVCANDLIAMGVSESSRERGVWRPVTGVDDSPLATDAPVPLTTIRLPLAELGVASVASLHGRLHPSEEAPPASSIPARLIVRRSSRLEPLA